MNYKDVLKNIINIIYKQEQEQEQEQGELDNIKEYLNNNWGVKSRNKVIINKIEYNNEEYKEYEECKNIIKQIKKCLWPIIKKWYIF